MPELPEVETVRRQLAGVLPGAVFLSSDLVEPAMLRDCSAEELEKCLPGLRVEQVARLGKFLLLRLSGADLQQPYYLTLHLGMTGQLLLHRRAAPALGPHSRFWFRLQKEGGDKKGGQRFALEFRDIRKFGRLHFTQGRPAPRLAQLGPDAWQGEWDADYLRQRIKARKAPLKAFLLDQRQLSGIGNIYADEILWWAGLSPLRPAGSLKPEEVARLATEIRRVLGEGVRLLGCSISDFVDTQGNPGAFQEWLRAYGRHGERCFRCGKELRRTIVAGRGTCYCPTCQG